LKLIYNNKKNGHMTRIAIIGDRGIPACYSGFGTLVEQLAVRLVNEFDFDVTVYCRKQYYDQRPEFFKGVRCVYLPSPGGKNFESIVHSNLAILHASFSSYDLALVLDPGNGPFVLPLKLRGTPIIIHTDGMGWKRQKWSRLQRSYYKWSEWVSARLGTWLVTDSRAMQDYYHSEYGTPSSFIPYAGEVGDGSDTSIVEKHGLKKGEYYLVVARHEPENNVQLIISEYRRSAVERPLVVVGENRYDSSYGRAIADESDDKVLCIGSVYNSSALNGLFENCYVYLHGHEVGGTNPSLLNAMHMGAAPIPFDVIFHRQVMGDKSEYFNKTPGSLAKIISFLDRDSDRVKYLRKLARSRSDRLYRWDAVAAAYAELFEKLLTVKSDRASYRDRFADDVYRPGDFHD
jgi:glycosyltransferase involved in cell wall biosynthesis